MDRLDPQVTCDGRQPVSEVMEDTMRLQGLKELANRGLGVVHGSHDERVERVGHVGGGLCIRRESLHVRDGDRNECDEVGMAVEMLQLGLGPGRDEEGDLVAFLG